MTATLPARLVARGASDAARIAIREAASGREWTYEALARGMRAMVATLRAHGLEAGERVATLGAASPAFLVADLGLLASGCVRVPLDPSLTAEEMRAQLKDSGARAIVHEPGERERARSLCDLAIDAGGIDTAPIDAEAALPTLDPAALASLNYTGGTTGEPKAVMLTHAAFAAIHATIVAHRPIHADDVFLNVRPLWPIAAVIVTAHLDAGATVVLGGRFDPTHFVGLLAEHRVTATSLVPTMLLRVLEANADGGPARGLERLRAIDVGGSALSPADRARAETLFGPRLGVIYGLTEASWTCYRPPGDAAAPPGTVGRPLGPNRIVVRAPDGTPVPDGEEGEVTIAGPHLMAGYWQRPAITAASLRDGWLHTGDVGRLDASGRLAITGRLKDVIRSGAKSVIPAEVEAAIASHPAVAECAVVGLPDREWGEVVAAAVVLKTGARIAAEALVAHCAERLASFKKPRRVVFVDALPRSHYGKVQRAKLIEAFTRP